MNALGPVFLHAADVWAENIWRASLVACLAIAVAWAIARWCTFLSPRIVCWVWRLACLKVLLALIWMQPVDLALLPAQAKASATLDAVPGTLAESTFSPRAFESELPRKSTLQSQAWPAATIAAGLLLPAWLIGVGYCLMRTARQWYSALRLRASSGPCATDRLSRLLQDEGQRLGVRRLPRVRFSSNVESPLLVGVWRPTIIFPAGLEEEFDEPELRLMIAHELAHRARHDLVWNWLPTVTTWLFFFHPLVWVMIRRWSEAQEAACDELLIQSRVARPAAYGRLLLKLSARSPLESGAGLAAAGVLGAYRNLQQRILAMTRVKPFSARRLMAATCVLSLAAVMTIIPWRLVAQEPKADPPQPITGVVVREREATSAVVQKRDGDEKSALIVALLQMYLDRDQLARLKTLEKGLVPPKQITEAEHALESDQIAVVRLEQSLRLSGVAESEIAQARDNAEATYRMQTDPVVQRALKRLKELGATPAGIQPMAGMSIGIQSGWTGTDADLDLLNDLPDLRWLFVDLNHASAEAVGKLKLTHPLKVLGLAGLSDERLAKIAHLPAGGRLILPQYTLTDDGWRRLAQMADGIEFLELSGGPQGIGDEGLKSIGQIHSLKGMQIFEQKITDAGLSHLAGLDKLESLMLFSCTGIPSRGYANLAALKALRHLTIYGMPIDADGLKALAKLTRLETLILRPEVFPSADLKPADVNVLASLSSLQTLEITKMGADSGATNLAIGDAIVAATGQMSSLHQLTVRGVGTDADGLATLAKVPHLEELLLDPVTLSDRSLSAIGELKNLRKLGLGGQGIVTAAGLAKLAKLQQITELSLAGSGLDDDGLRQLAGLHALAILRLPNSKVTGTGLSALANLKQLKTLGLANSPFGDEGAEALRALQSLEWLDLSQTKITDRSLEAIGTLANLRMVTLDGTSVTAGGLLKLRDLKHLSRISVVGTKTSGEEMARLHTAMPEVAIADEPNRAGVTAVYIPNR